MSDDLLARFERLEQRVAELEAENATLRSPSPAPGADAPTVEPTGMGRRRLLVGGATAGAAAVAGVVATGQPAAAANGGPVVLGQGNTASAETSITSSAGDAIALRVVTGSSTAAIEGENTGDATGVHGISVDGKAVHGTSTSGAGVQGTSTSGAGVWGETSTSRGVVGLSESFDGVYGESDTGTGAVGQSGSGTGVVGLSTTGDGIHGTATTGDGVVATATSGIGLRAESGSGYAVHATGGSGGVYGRSTTLTGDGIIGETTSGRGVYGRSTTGAAIVGLADSGTGVTGIADYSGTGVLARSSTGVALVARGTFAALRLDPYMRSAPPTADTVAHGQGEVVIDGAGAVWLSIAAGTPGTWRKIGGPATAGQLHVLPAPARVYDSRAGTLPTAVGPKTKFGVNETRTFDLKVNGSGVPAGATAALVTLLLTSASTTAGNLTVWANGVTKPLANTMVWGGTAGRFTATATTALDAQARVQVNASQPTDLVIDVVGYYR